MSTSLFQRLRFLNFKKKANTSSQKTEQFLREIEKKLKKIIYLYGHSKSKSSSLKASSMLNEIIVMSMSVMKQIKFETDHYLKQDDFDIYENPLSKLHQPIESFLEQQKKHYNKSIYFDGYPYQSLDIAHVFGARDTEKRYKDYNLDKYIDEKDLILDIGSNIGAMSMYCCFRKGCSAECVEHNVYMSNIGESVANYLNIKNNINFYALPFQEFQPRQSYTKIFSFAAHHTDDEGNRPHLYNYLLKLHSLLKGDGILFFESHNNDVGDSLFYQTMKDVHSLFRILDHKTLHEWGTREFYILEKI